MIPALDTASIKARPGSRLSDADAQEIAPRLFELERREGVITADAILADAADEGSPLHRFFEWDDSKAAHQHRLNTARTLARSITYRIAFSGPEISEFQPALVRLRETTTDGTVKTGYVSVTRAMARPDLQAQLLEAARREMDMFIRRYRTVETLATVMPLAEQLRDSIAAAAPAT